MNLSDLRRICDENWAVWPDNGAWAMTIDEDTDLAVEFKKVFTPGLIAHLLDCAEAKCNCVGAMCVDDCEWAVAQDRLDAYLKDCDAQ